MQANYLVRNHHMTHEEFVVSIEAARYLAVASCVFLGCEIVATLTDEIQHVWGSRWTFGRVIFHVNRVLGLIMLLVNVPTIFLHGLPEEACRMARQLYIYAYITVQIIVGSVLIARIWAIYNLKFWGVLAIIFGAVVVASPAFVIFQLQAKGTNLYNPDTTIVPSCPITSNSLAFIPYLPPFVSETVLFIITVYKPWKLNRTPVRTPLMTRLIQSGTQYYVVVSCALLVAMVGSLYKQTNHAVNESGFLTAAWSSMCTRLILSGRSWYNQANYRSETGVEMNSLPTVWNTRRDRDS